jgi:enoyl-[acyl-carrier protein] reductase I
MHLEGKKGVIFGIANHRSIAWGCARQLKENGAQFGVTYLNDAMERRVRPLGEEIGADFIERCDLTIESEVEALFKKASEIYGKLDFLIHSVAYASKEALSVPIQEVSAEQFSEALQISAGTLLTMARYAKPHLQPGASIVTMTYYGASRAIVNYGIMGVAKAALESEVRYLASDLGAEEIRVNAISAGPIRTLAASGVKGFRGFLDQVAERCAIKRSVTTEEVGNTCSFLVSPLSSGITGQVIFVDLGFSALS